ncbi:MAG TPA: hypothetical protein ENI90_08745 [Methylothermaceae bacterium]|nr:hypothetical protein [Methylothermaceae bacterium]
MRRISSFLGLLCFLVVPAVLAGVEEASVNGTGNGASRQAAIAGALADAAAQAFGVTIDASMVSEIASIETSTSEGEDSRVLDALNARVSTRLQRPGNRPILGYRVIRAERGSNGWWEAEVVLRYASYRKLGAPSSRRTVVVAARGGPYKGLVADVVEKALVDSRRFDILDRDDRDLYDQEKLFIRGDDAARAEIARLGNAVGADYLVIAELHDLGVMNNQQETIRLTGEVLVRSSFSGKLRMQVVEFSSRKVKWKDERRVRGVYEDVASITRPMLEREVGKAAGHLVRGMLDAIYPMRVVKVIGDRVIVNRGKGSVKVGERFRIFLVGEELVDPQSGESLGQMEVEVGKGVISEVRPKFAFLKVEKGQLEQGQDYLLRK